MFGSTTLEIAIGLIFVFWLLSLFSSAVTEAIAARLRLRAKGLEKAIRQILDDPDGTQLAKEFFDHPLIRALCQRSSLPAKPGKPAPQRDNPDGSGENLPSYVPSSTFASTVLDLLAPAEPGKVLTTESLSKALREAATTKKIEDGSDAAGKQALALALSPLFQQAGGDLVKLRQLVEGWFDDSMDRLTGWYKSRTQQVVCITAAIIVVFTNADTLMIVKKLSKDPTLRSAVVQQSIDKLQQRPEITEEIRKLRGQDPPEPYGDDYWEKQAAKADPLVRELKGDLNALNLLGWGVEKPDPTLNAGQILWQQVGGSWGGLAQKILGLFLTVLAVSLGAPFWFDMLNRLVNMRLTGLKPPPAAREGEAASEKSTESPRAKPAESPRKRPKQKAVKRKAVRRK